MVVPGLIGLWIDRQLGTVMVFLVLGMVLGMTTAIWHLVRLGASIEQNGPSHGKADTQPDKKPAEGDPGQTTGTEDRAGDGPNGT